MDGEDLIAVKEDPLPVEDGPKEEPAEAEERPDGEAVGVEGDPVVDPMMDDEGWIEDPLGELDDDSYIDWEAEVQHIDDVPPEKDEGEDPVEDFDGEGHIDWDAEPQHLNDILLEEQGMWLFDLDEDLSEAITDEEEEAEMGKPEVVDRALVEMTLTEEAEDIVADIVQ